MINYLKKRIKNEQRWNIRHPRPEYLFKYPYVGVYLYSYGTRTRMSYHFRWSEDVSSSSGEEGSSNYPRTLPPRDPSGSVGWQTHSARDTCHDGGDDDDDVAGAHRPRRGASEHRDPPSKMPRHPPWIHVFPPRRCRCRPARPRRQLFPSPPSASKHPPCCDDARHPSWLVRRGRPIHPMDAPSGITRGSDDACRRPGGGLPPARGPRDA